MAVRESHAGREQITAAIFFVYSWGASSRKVDATPISGQNNSMAM